LRHAQFAQRIARARQVRVDLQRLLEVGNRALSVAALALGDAAVVPGEGVVLLLRLCLDLLNLFERGRGIRHEREHTRGAGDRADQLSAHGNAPVGRTGKKEGCVLYLGSQQAERQFRRRL